MAKKRKKIVVKKAQEMAAPPASSMEKKYIQAAIGFFLVIAIGSFLFQTLKGGVHPQALHTQNIISPIPLHAATSESVSPSITPTQVTVKSTGTQAASTKSAVLITKDVIPTSPSATTSALVKKLPFTKSEPFLYSVREGDSVASIGTTFCDDPRAYLQIIEENNLIYPYILQVGDQLVISCR